MYIQQSAENRTMTNRCSDGCAIAELRVQWAEIERLPSIERLRMSLFDAPEKPNGGKQMTVVDVKKLGPQQRQLLVDKLINNVEEDNRTLLLKIWERMTKSNVEMPTVEVKFNNLCVDAECEVVHGRPILTLGNAVKSLFSVFGNISCCKAQKSKISIIKGVRGLIKPSRMTLLLGPPGCGKSTLLKALAGKLDQHLKVSGEVLYNDCTLQNLKPQKLSAYVSQYDLFTPEMTVRETIDFSARCQGTERKAEIMLEVSRREKLAGIIPDPDIDTFMKATSQSGLQRSLQTDYIMKILGLEICADTIVGDAMRRGISGGQKRRLATAEMIVGPARALFMDEITNGLDSSTAFQIIGCLQQFVHVTNATAIISLHQPASEIYNLFDDVMLFAEGKIVYHGPTSDALKFFEDCGFKCPERMGIADFLQEVISVKDQKQYWHNAELPCKYISVDDFAEELRKCQLGQQLDQKLSKKKDNSCSLVDTPYNSISSTYSMSNWELFKACMDKEILLIRRNASFYKTRLVQLVVIALITMTLFNRSRMDVDLDHTNYFLGSLFYGIIRIMYNCLAELSMIVPRLAVFYKQRDSSFYPAWAYSIASSLPKVPLSLVESIMWTALTYYVIGYTPEPGRFLRQCLMFFALHQASLSLFHFIASICRRDVTAIFVGNVIANILLLFGGFIIPQSAMPTWLRWGFWASVASYAEIGLAVNEFRAPRWNKGTTSNNLSIADKTLTRHGLNYNENFYWVSLGVMFGFAIIFNIGFAMALTFFNSPGRSRAIISHQKFNYLHKGEEPKSEVQLHEMPSSKTTSVHRGSISKSAMLQNKKTANTVLHFEALTLTFQHINYSVDTPDVMRKRGFKEKRLKLLNDVTGALRPGILTALMGISGAGKTTLLDVLAGRKNTGYIEGEIRIGGFPKVQESFARISGYCEQVDLHSPQITVEESLLFSAWLRLPSEIDINTKAEFVKDVLEMIELDQEKDSLVGRPGISGLSSEQRKRLTIAVELVSNPSVIFMDEPTSGLDARAASIVMRVVKNVATSGRTVVCTIHQPSIHIFEAFDEMILMKKGGKIIYAGPLGEHSSKVIDYFEGIPGLPKIKQNCNPATWILDVTAASMEAALGLDFAQVYMESPLYMENLRLLNQLKNPPAGSIELHFPTLYPCNSWEQFKACIWKQNLSYWRNPEYNFTRLIFMVIESTLMGSLMWQKGTDIDNEQDIFNIIASMFAAMQAIATTNCSLVVPVVAIDRSVFYREQFAGMYSSWAYSIAQVTIEIPYTLAQAALFVMISYPTIGLHWSASKVLWYFYATFCHLLNFAYLGMLIVAMSPNAKVASLSAAASYTILNLFSGFFLPGPAIPEWWIWCFWIAPTSWYLRVLVTSQYGDITKEIVAFGEHKALNDFLEEYFGFYHEKLVGSGIALMMFPIISACLFAFLTAKLNFQRR